MRILIIGKNGNLGRELTKILQAQHQLILWDRDETDITDQARINNQILEAKPEIVFNCAAYTDVDGAESNYELAEALNGYGAGYVAEACKEAEATLVHFSTGMVFDGTNPNGYKEDDAPNPVNAYGKSKLLGEELVAKKCTKFYIVRTEWLYAKPENQTAKKSFNEIILQLAKTQDVLKGVEDEVGIPTWAKDLATESINLAMSGAQFGIYHITNSGTASRFDWAKEILKLADIGKELLPVSGQTFPRPAKRPHYEILRNTKRPSLRTWQSALSEYFNKVK